MKLSNSRSRTIFLILVLILVPVLALSLTAQAYSQEGNAENDDEEEYDREIVVDMHDNYFEPDEIQVEPGEVIAFLVRNEGNLNHTFTVYLPADEDDDEDYREEPFINVELAGGEEEVVIAEMPEDESTLYFVCLPHEGIGMDGEIIVTEDPEIDEDEEDYNDEDEDNNGGY